MDVKSEEQIAQANQQNRVKCARLMLLLLLMMMMITSSLADSGNCIDSHSGGCRFESQLVHRLSCGFSMLSSVPPGKCRDSGPFRSQPLPSTSFPNQDSSITLPVWPMYFNGPFQEHIQAIRANKRNSKFTQHILDMQHTIK
jgi:hypothetical protein